MKFFFPASFRARDKPQNSVSAALALFFSSSAAGKQVNARTAIQVSSGMVNLIYHCTGFVV